MHEEVDEELDWESIAKEYAAGRTALACKNYYRVKLDPRMNHARLSKREAERLDRIVKAAAEEGWDWNFVSERLNEENRKSFVGDKKELKLRSGWSCFMHVLENERKGKGKAWMKQEDKTICEGVEIFGEHNWQDVAEFVGSR